MNFDALGLMGPGITLIHETSPHRSALARLIVMAANSKILAAVRPSRRRRRLRKKSCSRAANIKRDRRLKPSKPQLGGS